MGNLWKYIIIAVAVVLSAMVLAMAYTERNRSSAGTITVTGLGETVFTSDLIVIKGCISTESMDASEAYAQIEEDRETVIEMLVENGVSAESIKFTMPYVHELTRSVYNNGNYEGMQFAGYRIAQEFSVESSDVDVTESAARELPSLIAEGVSISVENPMYYYTGLEDVKLSLLSAAAADARERALNIAESSNAELGELRLSRAGVFQITASTGDEEFSAGGSFNLSSREKKARVTVRSEFYVEKRQN